MAWKKGILAIRMRTRQPKPRGQISDWGPMIAMGRGLRWRCLGMHKYPIVRFLPKRVSGKKGNPRHPRDPHTENFVRVLIRNLEIQIIRNYRVSRSDLLQ
jgi:hypothetical protein